MSDDTYGEKMKGGAKRLGSELVNLTSEEKKLGRLRIDRPVDRTVDYVFGDNNDEDVLAEESYSSGVEPGEDGEIYVNRRTWGEILGLAGLGIGAKNLLTSDNSNVENEGPSTEGPGDTNNTDDDVNGNQANYEVVQNESDHDYINELLKSELKESEYFEDNNEFTKENVGVEQLLSANYGEEDLDYELSDDDIDEELKNAIEQGFREGISEEGIDYDVFISTDAGQKMLNDYRQDVLGKIGESIIENAESEEIDPVEIYDEITGQNEESLSAKATQHAEDELASVLEGEIDSWVSESTEALEEGEDSPVKVTADLTETFSGGDSGEVEVTEDNVRIQVKDDEGIYNAILGRRGVNEDEEITLQDLDAFSDSDNVGFKVDDIRSEAFSDYEFSVEDFDSIQESSDGEGYVVDIGAILDSEELDQLRSRAQERIINQKQSEAFEAVKKSANGEDVDTDYNVNDWLDISDEETLQHLDRFSSRQDAVETVLEDEHDQYDEELRTIFNDYGKSEILEQENEHAEMKLSQTEVDYINDEFGDEDEIAAGNIVSNDWSGDGLDNLDLINLNEEVLGETNSDARLNVFQKNEYFANTFRDSFSATQEGVTFDIDEEGFESGTVNNGDQVAGFINRYVNPLAEEYEKERKDEIKKGFEDIGRFGAGLINEFNWTETDTSGLDQEIEPVFNNLTSGMQDIAGTEYGSANDDAIEVFSKTMDEIVDVYVGQANEFEEESERDAIVQRLPEFFTELDDLNIIDVNDSDRMEEHILELEGSKIITEGYNGWELVEDAEPEEVVKNVERVIAGGSGGGDDDDGGGPPREGGPIHSMSRELLGWLE